MRRQPSKGRWSSLPEDTLREWQTARLRRYLRDVVLPFSPYYRELFARQRLNPDAIRRFADLERISFTSKPDLLPSNDQPDKPRQFILQPDRKVLARRPGTIARAILRGRDFVTKQLEAEYRPVFLTSTTGRSAEPTPFLYTGHDLRNLEVVGRRLYEICGARTEFRMLNMFPYAPHLAFWLAYYGGTAFGVLVVSSGGGKVMGTEGQLRFLRKLNPDVLIGMPTFVYHVLHRAAEEGLRCDNLSRIVLGGEKVPAGMRRKLRELAGALGAGPVSVLATYGFTEAKMAWGECPSPAHQPASGYHLSPDLGIIEVIDPDTGRVLPSGRAGEIVFTPLDARGSVVLRYRTGDVIDGGLVYEPCPYCGRRLPRLVGSISRHSEVRTMRLDKIKGTLVDFNQLEHALDDAPGLGAWQIELRKAKDDPLEVDELILHVHALNHHDRATFSSELAGRIQAAGEVRPSRILFHTADEMRVLQGVGTQLKELRLVDHRPMAVASAQAAPGAGRPGCFGESPRSANKAETEQAFS